MFYCDHQTEPEHSFIHSFSQFPSGFPNETFHLPLVHHVYAAWTVLKLQTQTKPQTKYGFMHLFILKVSSVMTSYSLCMPTFRNNLPYKSLGRTDIYPVYGGSRFLKNAGNHLPNYTVSHAKHYYILNIQRSGKLVSYIYIKTPHTRYSWEADSHLPRLATLFYETPGFSTISKAALFLPIWNQRSPVHILQTYFRSTLILAFHLRPSLQTVSFIHVQAKGKTLPVHALKAMRAAEVQLHPFLASVTISPQPL